MRGVLSRWRCLRCDFFGYTNFRRVRVDSVRARVDEGLTGASVNWRFLRLVVLGFFQKFADYPDVVGRYETDADAVRRSRPAGKILWLQRLWSEPDFLTAFHAKFIGR